MSVGAALIGVALMGVALMGVAPMVNVALMGVAPMGVVIGHEAIGVFGCHGHCVANTLPEIDDVPWRWTN